MSVILLVDDNPDDVELTRRALRRSKVANELVAVNDGVEALDYLLGRGAWEGTRPLLPQMILLDLNLPRLGGIETLRQLRASPRTHALPVVILTSSKEDRDLLAAYELGANSYVRKPVDFEQFASAVQQLGLYWLVLNERAPQGRAQ